MFREWRYLKFHSEGKIIFGNLYRSAKDIHKRKRMDIWKASISQRIILEESPELLNVIIAKDFVPEEIETEKEEEENEEEQIEPETVERPANKEIANYGGESKIFFQKTPFAEEDLVVRVQAFDRGLFSKPYELRVYIHFAKGIISGLFSA